MSGIFTWQYRAGLPSYGEVFNFHRPDEMLVCEGVVVEFSTEGKSWIGNFAPGLGTLSTVHMIGSTAFVIAAGAGYRVDLAAPADYEVLQPGVIVESCVIEQLQVVVLAGLVNVCGYSTRGIKWTTPRLSADGVRLQMCTPSAITGVADRFEGSEMRYFSIDPETGEATIGARYP